jgi:aminocarboxymuconate-semialdehyde decarboxylase
MVGIASAEIIDVHAHVRVDVDMGAGWTHGPEFGVDEAGKPWYRVGKYRLAGVKHRRSPFTHPELRIQEMDRAGIDFQILSPSPLTYFHFIDRAEATAYCREWNDGLAELVGRYPDRLGGLATLPMQDPLAARDELQRAVKDRGLWGASTGTDFGRPLHGAELDPLFETFVVLDVPLFLHPAPAGIDGPAGDPNLKHFDLDVVVGFAAQETIAVASLIFGGVLERHPKLDVCVSDGGGAASFLVGRMAQAGKKRPWAPDRLKRDGALEEALSRLWFDTNVGDARSLDLLNRVANPAHLVYGTNFAGWDQQDDIKKGTVPPDLAANARRLLRKERASA